MSYITWSDKLSVRVPEMDAQHKRLVELLNDMHDSLNSGSSPEKIAGIIKNLVAYTKTHLTAEERFLEKIKYPMLQTHRAAHAKLIAQVLELEAKFEGGESPVAARLFTLLKEWLTDHIQQVDRRYGEFYVNQLAAKSGTKVGS